MTDRHPTLETYSGIYFDLATPRPEDVRLADLAVALANTCRFGGHVKRFYSVAEHACLVHRLVQEVTDDPALRLAALHHDSHEAYVGDIPTPMKQLLARSSDRFRVLCADIDNAVAQCYGFDAHLFDHPLVKQCDALALRIEAFELKPSQGAGEHWGYDEPLDVPHHRPFCMTPDLARAWFERAHVAAAGLVPA